MCFIKKLKYFLTMNFGAAFLYGIVVLIVSSLTDYLVIKENKSDPYLADFVAALAVMALFLAKAWFMRAKLARVDDYQSHTYYQSLKISNAAQMISGILDQCDHNYDTAHEQCRAAVRKQVQVIKSAIGQAPNPELIRGNLERQKNESMTV